MSSTPVTSSHFPYLPLTLTVRGRIAAIEALLDTGFDGHVVVPIGLITNGMVPDGSLEWMLADGSVVQAPAYIGSVQVGSFAPVAVVISVLGDEPIVGRAVSDSFRVTLDHGQRVIVEP